MRSSATNVRTIGQPSQTDAANIQGTNAVGTHAECSRPGEDNSMHVVIAVAAIGLIAAAAGWINVKIAAG